MTGPDVAVWLYAIAGRPGATAAGPQAGAAEPQIDAAGLRLPDGLTGVAGETPRAVSHAGLVAVVGSVDLAEFGEQPLRAKLERLPTLEPLVRAHHAVVDAMARLGPVIPARLATLYHDDAAVVALLTEGQTDLTATLRRVTDRTEWGVRVYAVEHTGTEPPPALTPAGRPVGKGAAYLLRRRAELTAAEDARRAAVEGAESVHRTLAGLAAATSRQAPQDGPLPDGARWLVLNGAYLVDDDRFPAFGAAVKALGSAYPGLRLELTGPWPPYSFAGSDSRPEQR
jgi:hypothetical protein